jgi:two-component system response regulator PilR (NtrC family)
MYKILIVDDERSMREFLKIMLEKDGYAITTASNAEEAIKLINGQYFDMVITDMKMPQGGGLSVLEEVKRVCRDTIVIIITAYATQETRLKAFAIGAYDYISKPFRNEEVKIIIKKALEKRDIEKENFLLRKELASKYGFDNIIGKSSQLEEVFTLIKKVANTKINILIRGESGTGKELIARAIHNNSSRKNKPLITINCAAIAENLIESELFGHKKGAFTGAIANKPGLCQAANNGTLFLDEFGEVSPALQVKILRFIQEKQFTPVGGTEIENVDVRIIAATNKDLESEVKKGNFREDLYYRLNVLQIFLPPLKDRKEDIALLAEHFLHKYATELNKNIHKISREALTYLQAYDYPGNVRELENIIERSVALEQATILLPETLPLTVLRPGSGPNRISREIPESKAPAITLNRTGSNRLALEIPDEGLDLEETLQNFEKDIILKALAKTGGLKKQTAKLLRIKFRSLRYRLETLRISTSLAEADEGDGPENE